MPPSDDLLAFAVTAFVLIVVPGPSVLFVIGRAIAHGRRAALVSVLGNASGVFLQASCIAVGVGAIVSRSLVFFTLLRLLGACYLVFLGVQAIRDRKALGRSSAAGLAVPTARHRFRQGLIVGVTNPKGFALFSAVLPQFVDRTAGHVQLQMLVLGAMAVSIAVVTDSMWAVVAGTARDWFARSAGRSEALSVSGGAMMMGLGVQLAVSGRRD